MVVVKNEKKLFSQDDFLFWAIFDKNLTFMSSATVFDRFRPLLTRFDTFWQVVTGFDQIPHISTSFDTNRTKKKKSLIFEANRQSSEYPSNRAQHKLNKNAIFRSFFELLTWKLDWKCIFALSLWWWKKISKISKFRANLGGFYDF